MLVDSFDKKHYAPTRSLETKTDFGKRNFKSILQQNSEIDNSSSILEKSTRISRHLQPVNSPADALNNKYQNATGNSQKIHIGTLSDDTPTVSELLYNTPYKKSCWELLESDVNSSKRFKKIPSGANIYLDRQTSEIVWEKDHIKKNLTVRKNSNMYIASKSYDERESGSKNISAPAVYKSKQTPYKSPAIYKQEFINLHQSQSASAKSDIQTKPALHNAVREFMGEDYSKIDCYELVVNGLKNMGVKYDGKGGLGRHLIDKAIDEGLSKNHYLTGEGLLEATGQSVYNKSVLSVKNPESQAQSAMQEMEKVLKEGQILSFSTRTRGHTGVISKRDGVWTFINSGYMDNNIAGENGRKQVGEEILSKELENWFKLAGNKKDGLQITLGDIDLVKISAYRTNKSGVSEKV